MHGKMIKYSTEENVTVQDNVVKQIRFSQKCLHRINFVEVMKTSLTRVIQKRQPFSLPKR